MWRRSLGAVCVLSMLAISVVALAQESAKAEAPAVPSPTKSGIRAVDWANFAYGAQLRLHDGRMRIRRYLRSGKPCRHTSNYADLRGVAYGDLTGDGVPEAVVTLQLYRQYCRGRNLHYWLLLVYTQTAAGPKELSRLSLPYVRDVTADSGWIHGVVESASRESARRWRLEGSQLVADPALR